MLQTDRAPDVCKQQRARPAWLVRLCCAPSLSTHATLARFQKRRTAHQSHATGQCTCCSSRVSPIAGLLILPSSPVCELDALRVACMRERSFSLDAVLDVCPARKHSYPSPWPGRPERLVARSFSRPCTRVDRLERMSISVAISRWADVRVTMVRGRALPWASSRISSLFSCTPAQSRAASNPFALAVRA